jgi:hypothetical protein
MKRHLLLLVSLLALGLAGCPRATTTTVPPAPTQYTEKQVSINSKLTFSVTADGTQPFTYQWHKNGVFIVNAIGAEYIIDAVKNEDSGDYSCVVSNSAGGTLSDTMRINVSNKPSNVVVSLAVEAK